MFIKNADQVITSVAKTPKEYYGFYVTYRPPLGGPTFESKAEWDLINKSLGGGVQGDKEEYHDTFFDYITKYMLQKKLNEEKDRVGATNATGTNGGGIINFKLVGVMGGDYGEQNSISSHSIGLTKAKKKTKYLNKLGSKKISVNPKKRSFPNDVMVERYTIENSNAINRSWRDLQTEMNDVHRQSKTAQLEKQKQKLVKRAQAQKNKAIMERANKSGRNGFPVFRYGKRISRNNKGRGRGGSKKKKTRRRTKL
jgi:hypothetical protein